MIYVVYLYHIEISFHPAWGSMGEGAKQPKKLGYNSIVGV